MNPIENMNNIPKDFVDDPAFLTKLKTVMLGDFLGSEKIYVNIDFIKPGGKSTKYHSHSDQEEFFLILSGNGILRTNEKEIPVKEGDAFSKPAGKGIAHQFLNNSSEVLQILDVGTREKNDVVTYPDENTVYLKSQKLVFHTEDQIDGWTSDPNEEN